ncbi:uncharacterized protein [Triticum aestivum]|uniref:uncharacterized protein isoform X1 n=2 Tax=Triticum TaxID=4564 RepID=UPI00084483E6|nr:uncharacterized protein LOC123089445 isoform X1 [Triticum aestivum]
MDPGDARGIDILTSIAADLHLEPRSRSVVVDGTSSDPICGEGQAADEPKFVQVESNLVQTRLLKVGNAGSYPGMGLRQGQQQARRALFKHVCRTLKASTPPDTLLLCTLEKVSLKKHLYTLHEILP